MSRADRIDLLTPTEVATLLRVTPRTIHRYAADGKLPRIRIGRRMTRYRREDVLALISTEDQRA